MTVVASVASAQGGVLFVDRHTGSVNLGNYAKEVEDPEGTLSLMDLMGGAHEKRWRKSQGSTVNHGFTSSVFFIKVSLKNNDPESLDTFLEIAYPLIDHIKVDFIRNGRLAEGYLLGDNYPFSARLIEHRNYIVPVRLKPDESVDMVFRVKTRSSLQVPLTLSSEKSFIRRNQMEGLCYGLYYGIMMAMIVYNLFVFISVREISYLYYVFYVSSMTAFLLTMNGFSYQYFWPDHIWWNEQFLAASIGSVVLFAHLFTRKFLDLPGRSPWMNEISIYLAVFLFLNLTACFIVPYGVIIFPVIIIAVTMIFLSLVAAIILWIGGYTAARYYTLSWFAMLLGGAVLALNKLALIPRNVFTENALQIGSAVEVLFLSFALADRLSTEKTVRFEAQRKALKNEQLARAAQAKALELEKEANENLEMNVRMRTHELEVVNDRLRELSTTDSLTGLKNRRYFNEIYYREYNRAIREKTPLSCLIMDIDHFKRVNDSYGHLLGDECLKEVAQAIKAHLLRENDFLSRYGGEEFCVLLTNTSEEGALQVAENIRLCVEDLHLVKNGAEIPITLSIGVSSEIPVHKKYAETLLNQADEALYRSKALGRNRVTLFAAEPQNKDHPEPRPPMLYTVSAPE